MEKVMVVAKSALYAAGFEDETGFFAGAFPALTAAIVNSHIFMERGISETDYDYKQIIPYTVVKYKNKYLLLKRLSKQGEKRLHGMLSIGVGGHINENERQGGETMLINGALRELNEEVRVSFTKDPVFMGFLNDNEADVGRVHLGLVYLLAAEDGVFKINEKDKMEGGWAAAGELAEKLPAMEGWSRILIESGLIC